MNDRQIDQVLVERAQKGEQKAFEMLMSKYQRRLIRLISRFVKDEHEVNDVAQEAMIRAYRALPNFRSESAFYTWLYRIAINTAKNFLVTSGKLPFVSAEAANEDGDILDLSDQIADYHTPEAEMINREILQTVRINDFAFARGLTQSHYLAGNGRFVLRGNSHDYGLPDRDGPFPYF